MTPSTGIFSPGLSQDGVAGLDLVDRNLDLDAVVDDGGRLRRQPHQLLYRFRGAALGDRLQRLAEEDQGDDDAGVREVEALDRFEIAGRDLKYRIDAVEKGRRRAHRDETVHVRREPEYRPVADEVEAVAGSDDRKDQGLLRGARIAAGLPSG